MLVIVFQKSVGSFEIKHANFWLGAVPLQFGSCHRVALLVFMCLAVPKAGYEKCVVNITA